MGFNPLIWYCRPEAYGIWAQETDSAFGAYTPCGIDSIVICISHLVLLGLCLYRIWLIKRDSKVQRFHLRSNIFNYVLGFLAGCCAAEPLFRLGMGISVFNLGKLTGLAPFEVCISFSLPFLMCSFLFYLFFRSIFHLLYLCRYNVLRGTGRKGYKLFCTLSCAMWLTVRTFSTLFFSFFFFDLLNNIQYLYRFEIVMYVL